MLEKLINKYFSYIIYLIAVSVTLFLLFQAKESHLLPFPQQGTDQLSVVDAAVGIYHGKMPPAGYKMSPGYTLFAAFLVALSGSKLLIMRILQALTASLIPVFIYKLSRRLRIGFQASQIAALIYCFYGPAILISLDFLRASMLALCFLIFAYCLITAFFKKSNYRYLVGGVFAGLTILGRENFIPIVFLPLGMLLFAECRNRVGKKQVLLYLSAVFLTVLPCLVYNFVNFGSLSIIPGNLNTVVSCYHGAGLENISDASYRSEFLENIPVQFLKFISSYELPNSLSFYAHREIIDFMRVFIVPFNFILILAAIGAIFNCKNRSVLFVVLLSAGYVGTMLYFEMFYRFRIPVVPLITILSGAGVYSITKIKGKPWRLVVWCGVFILTWITYANPDKYRLPRERVSVAVVLIQNERLLKAEDYLDKLSGLSIVPGRVWMLLARRYAEAGDQVSAARVYKKFLSHAKNPNGACLKSLEPAFNSRGAPERRE